jgi:capsid protein
MFRLFELEKVLCGDAGLLKLNELKLQAIESDLIAKGTDAPETVNDSGLLVDSTGRVLQYAICNRGCMGAECKFDHLEPASNLIFDGYWNRFSSQFRGVSPLSTAINTVQDIHEAFEFNLIKAKMHALFGVAIYRDAQGDSNMGGASGAHNTRAWVAESYAWVNGDYCTYLGKVYYCNTAHSTTSASSFATDLAAGKWTADTTDTGLDLDPRTINMLDLNPGEKAEVLESSTPSTEFVEGSYLFIQIAMLALDIPITSFDSRRSSFSARIADLNEYEVSVDYKRTKNRYVRKEYSDWVLETIWNDSTSPWQLRKIASAEGMALRDVQESVEWIPSGSPWLDKYKQIQGDQLGISIGLDNAIDACRRRGGDVFANIDKQSQVNAYAKSKGVSLVAAPAGTRTVDEVEKGEIDDADSKAAQE